MQPIDVRVHNVEIYNRPRDRLEQSSTAAAGSAWRSASVVLLALWMG